MKHKKLIFLIIFLALLVGVLFFVNFIYEKPGQIEEPGTGWKGKQLSCANYSCNQLNSGNRNYQAYNPCLVQCAQEYKKYNDGQFNVIVPVGYEALAKKNLADMKNCFPLLEKTLGMTPYYDQLYLTFVLGDENKDFASPEASSVYYYRTKKSLDSELKRDETGRGSEVGADICNNGHELTHIFTGQLNLPHWASEGIATYAAMKNSSTKLVCYDEGWKLSGSYAQTQIVKSYADLNKSWNSKEVNAQNNWYNTAACVFVRLEQKYGADKVIQLLKTFEKYATTHEPDMKIGDGLDRFSSKVFIESGIIEVLGDKAKLELKTIFGL
ncbi:MAG: hypothetical protein AAB766_04465 [Patescibacteria group bacterium]